MNFVTYIRNKKSQNIGRTLLTKFRIRMQNTITLSFQNVMKVRLLIFYKHAQLVMQFCKKLVTYNTVSLVIKPRRKKNADIPIDAGISHPNIKKRKQCKNIRNALSVVKIPIVNGSSHVSCTTIFSMKI